MSNSSEDLSDSQFNVVISSIILFWTFLFSNILSILCCLFVLYYLLFYRNLRGALYNHVIIILLLINLIYELTDISFILHYYRVDRTWQVNLIFARFWTFIDFGFYTIQLLLFSWATIERHILIFHYRYYNIVIFYPSCQDFNYQLTINGVFVPCIYFDPIFSKLDIVFHQFIPTLNIVILSIGLLVHILWQKTRLNRSIQWRQQRKLAVQILSIAIIYLFFQMPWVFLQFCYVFGLPIDTERIVISYATVVPTRVQTQQPQQAYLRPINNSFALLPSEKVYREWEYKDNLCCCNNGYYTVLTDIRLLTRYQEYMCCGGCSDPAHTDSAIFLHNIDQMRECRGEQPTFFFLLWMTLICAWPCYVVRRIFCPKPKCLEVFGSFGSEMIRFDKDDMPIAQVDISTAIINTKLVGRS
ncbi:unnamed protein product [Adineta steineri]|uniref:Uncharacterized protein n=1 Tax=Adineta steineri TaxID=433720 RepID=A0A814TTS6_9BILA|nr:unnamed protein product [Adineta steineri]CAF1166703.1 unnamed protein product [Adineta steineri]